jgi:methylated-DNA-[protein]-cysteine S-methyltransferase
VQSTFKQFKMISPVGPLFLVASANGLCGIFWKKQSVPMVKDFTEKSKCTTLLAQTVKELNEYFSGKRQAFTVPLDFKGTEFQMRVWEQLRKIPYGETCSYKDMAKTLKSKAVRAVGSANGKNPLSIMIPCHRVINANGKLGGYAGSVPVKVKLLELEQKFN